MEPALNKAEWFDKLVSGRKSSDKQDRRLEWMEATSGTEEEYRRACIRGGAIELAHADYFTWDDVDALMESPPDEPTLTEIADRIAALLPPRDLE